MSDREELEIICTKLRVKVKWNGDMDGDLIILNLHGLGLKELPHGIFDKLSSLVTITLGNNKLKELPEGIFDHNSSIRALDLSHNKLKELPHGIFDQLPLLEHLHLDGNLITTPSGVENKRYSGKVVKKLVKEMNKWYELKADGKTKSRPSHIVTWEDLDKRKHVKEVVLIQQILKIISQVRVDIPMTLLRLSELVELEKDKSEKILESILDQQPDLGEYLPLEQVFIKKSEVKEEIFTQSSFKDSLQKCPQCGDNQSILIRTCTNCGEPLPHCNICKRGFVEKDQNAPCPECYNPFHKIHLMAQIQSSGSCPICKTSLNTSQFN